MAKVAFSGAREGAAAVELPPEQEIASDVLHPKWATRAAIPARTTASMEGRSGYQGVFGRIV